MNRGKYILNMTLSIILITACGLLAAGYAVVFISNIETPYIYGNDIAYVSLAIMSCANLAICVIALILCQTTIKLNERTNMLIIVLIAVLFVSIATSIIRAIEFKTLYSGIELFFYLLFVALAFITLFINHMPAEEQAVEPLQTDTSDEEKSVPVFLTKQQHEEQTIEYKIAQVKHMRKLCLISDDQAMEAIDRLITNELKKSETHK